MRSNRPPWPRPFLAGLAVSFGFAGAVGCSDSSRQSGTQAPVLEADRQAMLKSAEARKQRIKTAKAKSPRSKQGFGD